MSIHQLVALCNHGLTPIDRMSIARLDVRPASPFAIRRRRDVQYSHIVGYMPEEGNHAASGHPRAKNETSDIIRAVREERAEYVVTLRRRPVVIIMPVQIAEAEAKRAATVVRENAAFWDRMAALGVDIAAKWQSDKTGVELIEEQRR